eukprot:CAMPEP_0115666364 /NCGR_PEP_ID=MMETSP0272-20121206/49376_1 /TAXON_ID=71861 /ORGANISM="Scrippsiella trochoidea, Strain CCMP3099" /LENGTH=76 /DNA_ID=CAMNT_0003104857 /DNA_START=53 /DNA_END=281 /DNA_ORIENTATION=-
MTATIPELCLPCSPTSKTRSGWPLVCASVARCRQMNAKLAVSRAHAASSNALVPEEKGIAQVVERRVLHPGASLSK